MLSAPVAAFSFVTVFCVRSKNGFLQEIPGHLGRFILAVACSRRSSTAVIPCDCGSVSLLRMVEKDVQTEGSFPQRGVSSAALSPDKCRDTNTEPWGRNAISWKFSSCILPRDMEWFLCGGYLNEVLTGECICFCSCASRDDVC